MLKTLGVNTGVATGVIAIIVTFGALFRDTLTPFLADHVFKLTDHVLERVKDSNEIVDTISEAVREATLTDIVGKIDAGYSISVSFSSDEGDEAPFSSVTQNRIVAFHAKKGQRVCIAQQPVFNGVDGEIEIRIDGKPWKSISSHEDWDAPTDVTSFISFEGGLRGVHIHEVELVPALTVNPAFAALANNRGGAQFLPGALVKLVILVYKGDQRECLE